jgi:hypothetical protein
MGPVQEIPFIENGLNKWVFPSCLFFMVLLTLTDAYNRFMRCIGIKTSYASSKNSNTIEKIIDG